jgi:hypothetical protein
MTFRYATVHPLIVVVEVHYKRGAATLYEEFEINDENAGAMG